MRCRFVSIPVCRANAARKLRRTACSAIHVLHPATDGALVGLCCCVLVSLLTCTSRGLAEDAPAGEVTLRIPGGSYQQTFGAVQALGPATRTVLNVNPPVPGPYYGLTRDAAFVRLAASLSPDQWKKLIDPKGIGKGDLTTGDQRELYDLLMASIAGINRWQPGEGAHSAFHSRMTPPMVNVRVRLCQEVFAGFDAKGPRHRGISSSIPLGITPDKQYTTGWPIHDPSSPVTGSASMQAQVVNSPRTGDLNTALAPLGVPTPLAGITTVKDLITAVSQATGLELYADRRLEDLEISISGGTEARSGDLLEALAFCLAGTYRKVGPAYVLTDDIVGIGTRLQRLYDFDRTGNQKRDPLTYEAHRTIAVAHPLEELPFREGAISLTPQQLKSYHSNPPEQEVWIETRFEDLPPDQQAAVRDQLERLKRDSYSLAAGANLTQLIALHAAPSVELLVPGLDAPVDLEDLIYEPMFGFYRPHTPRTAAAAPVPGLSVRELLTRFPERAAMVAPHTPQEVAAIVQSARALGLNEIWIVPSSPLTPDTLASSAEANGYDLVQEALLATEGTGIRVFPVMDALSWSDAAPPGMRERNILGQDSVEMIADPQGELTSGGEGALAMRVPHRVAVCPMDPGVQQTLLEEVRRWRHNRAIAGMVWRRIGWPGYISDLWSGPDSELGYSEKMRLAFLRQKHADPIDIDPQNNPWILQSNLSRLLPHFLDGTGPGWVYSGPRPQQYHPPLRNDWDKFRRSVQRSFLTELVDAAHRAAPSNTADTANTNDAASSTISAGASDLPLDLFVEDRENGSSFARYGSTRASQPSIESSRGHDAYEATDGLIHSDIIYRVRLRDLANPAAAAHAIEAVKGRQPGEGVVLDFAPDDQALPDGGIDAAGMMRRLAAGR